VPNIRLTGHHVSLRYMPQSVGAGNLQSRRSLRNLRSASEVIESRSRGTPNTDVAVALLIYGGVMPEPSHPTRDFVLASELEIQN
jgi:hypothetical protein